MVILRIIKKKAYWLKKGQIGIIWLILKKILKTRIKVYIYEPLIKDKFYMDTEIINNFEDFIKSSDLVIANRIDNKIKKSSTKYFTRDLFGEN